MASALEIRRTVVIGSGPAGLTAAIYAARAGLKPLVLAGSTPGGQLTLTSEVENFPGFRKGILGPELMENMLEQAKFCGAEVLWESATRIAGPRPSPPGGEGRDEQGESGVRGRPFTVTTDGGQAVQTHTVIYATGAAPRYLGLASEKKYMPPNGSGVTSCAVCDGSFYKKRPVAVVGGGDSAMEEATYLSNLCSTVTIIHRREGFRASKVMLERARAKANLQWELNQVVDEILGDPQKKAVTGLRLKNVKDGSMKEIQVAAVFMAIGHIPATAILKGLVELDEEGFIKCDSQQQTNAPGFFAAGDCHDRRYRQAVTAAGMGCKAALEAERFLTHEGLI